MPLLNKRLPCLDAGVKANGNGNKRPTLIKRLGVAFAHTCNVTKLLHSSV